MVKRISSLAGYERLIVGQSPSRSGKYLKGHMEEEGNRPEWAFGRSGGQDKPIDIYDYPKKGSWKRSEGA